MEKFVADLHAHSSYARATSPSLNFDTLSSWAKLKGINLLASSDFTHPVWWQETKTKLVESKHQGFYKFKDTHFVLGTEISCIYTQGGRQRRIHCLLYFPEKKDVETFNLRLGEKANLKADGRPIVGLSAKQLLELALGVNEKAILIPAHAWTPWFSLYGSNSGFDSISDCFGDLSRYIYAIETGLSSDPAMNWRIKELDNRSIVSFSDLHSAPKMGREATVFDTEFSYDGLLAALKSAQLPKQAKILMTIEFFPEEGKYHYTGHRNCSVRHSPAETAKYGVVCPSCKRKLTVGVMHRVEELSDSDRPLGFKAMGRPPFKLMVPLLEIIAEVFATRPVSQRVQDQYRDLVKTFGSELAILLKTSIDDLEKQTQNPKIVEGIKKVRNRDIVIDPGYDGVYGKVKIWPASPKTDGQGGNGSKAKSSRNLQDQAGGQASFDFH